MDLILYTLVSKQNIFLQLHESFRQLFNTNSQMVQKQQFPLLQFIDVLLLLPGSIFVLVMQFIEVYFDGFVGVASVLGCAERADEGMLVALGIKADEVDFLTLMPLLGALDVLDDVSGGLLFHDDKDLYLNQLNFSLYRSLYYYCSNLT